MTHSMGLMDLFWQASMLVKLVMLMLLAASVCSWTIIFQRKWLYDKTQKACASFRQQFWSGQSMGDFFEKMNAKQKPEPGVEAIFVAAYKMYRQVQQEENLPIEVRLKEITRAMSIEHERALRRLENQLPFLATVQSMSPYVGLFGTVWGIMQSFRALGQVQQATLAMVAPGISEALIATAIGLVAAIPAGIAYNRFVARQVHIQSDTEVFMQELLSIFQRNLAKQKASKTI